MPNLADCIRCEIENDRLNPIFSASEIKALQPLDDDTFKVCGRAFKASTIDSNLGNYSIGPGDRQGAQIKRGRAPWFLKLDVGKDGRYTLIDDDQDEEDTVDNSGASDELVVSAPPIAGTNCAQIARDFVNYLRDKPFRLLLNQGNQWYPNKGAISGWNARLDAYSWKGSDWAATEAILEGFKKDLVNLRKSFNPTRIADQEESYRIYEAIRKWGNPNGTKYSAHFLAQRLDELWSTSSISQVDSTLTKFYALADPTEYVIYDSRVAAAMLFIAEDIYRFRLINRTRRETVNIIFHPCYPALGRYPGAGGTRPRGNRWKRWPNAYKSVAAQLDANKLCKAIVDRLNAIPEEGRSNWNLREVEAVLFMEGY